MLYHVTVYVLRPQEWERRNDEHHGIRNSNLVNGTSTNRRFTHWIWILSMAMFEQRLSTPQKSSALGPNPPILQSLRTAKVHQWFQAIAIDAFGQFGHRRLSVYHLFGRTGEKQNIEYGRYHDPFLRVTSMIYHDLPIQFCTVKGQYACSVNPREKILGISLKLSIWFGTPVHTGNSFTSCMDEISCWNHQSSCCVPCWVWINTPVLWQTLKQQVDMDVHTTFMWEDHKFWALPIKPCFSLVRG